jgi:hypothetical protein
MKGNKMNRKETYASMELKFEKITDIILKRLEASLIAGADENAEVLSRVLDRATKARSDLLYIYTEHYPGEKA